MTETRPDTRPSGPAKASFAHVILTRFNVRWDEAPTGPSIGTDPAWLGPRFELFERYCLPSILGQSRTDFSWIIFFDHETPPEFAERARALAKLRPGIFPTFCQSLPLSLVRETIENCLPDTPEWLLTTRLDNDDGLHRDFVATVQDGQGLRQAEVLNCPLGIVLNGDRAYRQRHTSNAFISLSEPFADARTIFSIQRHVYASESYPVRQLARSPMWLQVIHDSNVSNRVRGQRLPMAHAKPGFPALADRSGAAAQDAPLSILAENLTLSLARSLRDLAALSARRLAKLIGVDLRRKAVPRMANKGSQ